MPARIISGKDIAAEMRAELEPQVVELQQRGITPGLAVVLVGEDPASQVYVRMKAKACEKLGMHSETITLPEATTEDELLAAVDRLNANPAIHGFLVQLPLPDHIDSERVLLRILPTKDVDGFHPENVGRVAVGDPTAFPPATPFGVQHLLMRSGVQIEGSHVVIVGRSNIVGRPMASLLLQRGRGGNATVTVCHSHTKNLPDVTRLGDILIVAIDVGTNRVDDPASEKGYRLVGDVDFEAAQQVASAITPVPGGVGPMTITMLLYNTLQAARRWAEN